jgi:folylpolyglutamate synthase/dihydrofolate synthase
MSMEKEQFLEWMYGLRSRGVKLDLSNTTELLDRLDNPHRSFKSVHIAGTDGKGSVSACIDSILRTSGVKTGLYTSPHIVNFNERISVDGKNITDDELASLIQIVMPVAELMEKEGKQPTFFEITTAMAFLHFRNAGVEYAVVEVGMGGRLDSTNVIVPEVCVITNISIDHSEFLGTTTEEIASEKAGILKSGVPCVTMNAGSALSVIKRKAEETGAILIPIAKEDTLIKKCTVDRVRFTYLEEEYEVSMSGRYQAFNASLAIEAVSRMKIYGQCIRCNLKKGLKNVKWPCRMEKLTDLPMILDVTHTSAGSKVLAEGVKELYGNVTLVFGLLDDKDAEGIVKNLSRIANKVIVTSPESERAATTERIYRVFSEYPIEVIKAETVSDAMDVAMKIRENDMILVTGSFHMAGDAIKWLKKTYAGY